MTGLAGDDSSGALTARAVVVLHQIDEEIEAATDGEWSLDEVVKRLSSERGDISTERFRRIAEEVAGHELPAFARYGIPRTGVTTRASSE